MKKTLTAWFFIALYFAICLYIHMEQLQLIPGKFVNSDLPAHISISNEGWTIYTGIFLIIRILYQCLSANIAPYAVAILFSCLDLLGVLTTAYFFKYIERQQIPGFLLLYEALALNIVINCTLPKVSSLYIRGNMWGNISYAAMKPFALITFFVFIEIRKNQYMGNFKRSLLCFLIFLTIVTGLKPNFTVGLMPLVGCSVIYDFLKKKVSFKKSLLLATAFIPSLYIMYKQYRILFQSDGSGGTVLAPGYAFAQVSDYVMVMLLLSVLFPLIISINNVSKIRNDIFSRSVIYFWLVNLGIAFLFAESGYRQNHGNFLWGLYFATFLWFIDACRWYYKNIVDCIDCKLDKNRKIVLLFASIALVFHLTNGISYLIECIV